MKRIMLSDIVITHISLVKAGANGKEFIYKSADAVGGYESIIAIKKQDDELGVVYGIVYAPDEVDSQGDMASAKEIQKAAWSFMKARNTRNVDMGHSFENEDAFVAESWITKSGDAIFGDEPVGSWAVAIKLESEELKTLAKSGELKGLSMAGEAKKTPLNKEEGGYKSFFAALAEATTGLWLNISASIEKDKGNAGMEEAVQKEMKSFKERMDEAITKAQESQEAQSAQVESLAKESTAQAQKTEALAEQVEVLQKENEALTATVEKQATELEALKKETAAMVETVKTSKQKASVKKQAAPQTTTEGIL